MALSRLVEAAAQADPLLHPERPVKKAAQCVLGFAAAEALLLAVIAAHGTPWSIPIMVASLAVGVAIAMERLA